ELVPLVDLDGPSAPAAVAAALQQSGFLLVRSGALSAALQRRALAACQELLAEEAPSVEAHPSDPKRYRMLCRGDLQPLVGAAASTGEAAEGRGALGRAALLEYWSALEALKRQVLRAIAEGLGLEPDFLAGRHAEDNDTLRLLHYPPAPGSGNRCKEHSDYGTVTLLTTDGTAGLEIWDADTGVWCPVPLPSGERRQPAEQLDAGRCAGHAPPGSRARLCEQRHPRGRVE
ncbi:unnamed protein product, partial [Polarella glacialis]